MRKNKGITLVALIITIIVMIILIAVTVSILINSNVIGQAKSAGERTKTAYNTEGNFGDLVNIDGAMYNSIDEYIEAGSPSIEHDWHREDGDWFWCECELCTSKPLAPHGLAVGIGDVVEFEHTGTGQATIATNKSGYSESQTIEDENPTWVVLGIKDCDGNGTNETLLLTTEKPTEDIIYLSGEVAYNNWIAEADRIAKALYGNNARAMTIEDVNDCLQYTPLGGQYTDSSHNKHTVDGFNIPLENLTEIWNNTSGIGTTTLTPDGSTLGDNLLTGYGYHISELNDAGETAKALVFGSLGWNYSYLLASMGVWADYQSAGFGAFVVSPWTTGPDTFFSSTYGGLTSNFPFRAVIELKGEVPGYPGGTGDFSTTFYPYPD